MRAFLPLFASSALLACGDNTLGVRTAAPTVNITSPADGAGFYEYEPITLVARVDDERTPLDELVYAWTANGDALPGDGVLTGQDLALSLGSGLAAGAYTLRLEVTDADGLAASDSVGVEVTQDLPPVVTLLLPTAGAIYDLGDPVTVRALVTDVDAASNEELSLTWGADAEGAEGAPAYPDASGYAQFELEGLPAGARAVDVTVTDAAGGIGFATVAFEVVDPDGDGDGYADDDCDDTDPLVYPGAEETCDGLDNDCDGEVDNDPVDPSSWYADNDGDGHGATGLPLVACDAPEGYVDSGDDCDDADPAVFPGADESDCTDPTDYNCDGLVGYADADGDGYAACADCDDTDPTSSPSAVEYCDGVDNDCNGTADDGADDLSTWYADNDGDGYGAGTATLACDAAPGEVGNDDDCDDTDADFHPGATEEPCVATEDYDCDGTVATLDTDGDGEACDCDEGDPTVNSGAAEACDGVDNDCDGTVDEAGATGESTFYADSDGDGYGDDAVTADGCSAPAGHVATGGDCDDGEASVNPAATEVCDDLDVDEDCDGGADDDDPESPEGVEGESLWIPDLDMDGTSSASDYYDASRIDRCDDPGDDWITADGPYGDCDDTNASVNPTATEFCDGVDNDCDGDIDEDDAADAPTWYLDDDADGYGNTSATSAACGEPGGYVENGEDCDDDDANVNPAATETCDGVDNDCDGATDEGVSTTYFADADGDGYGDASSTGTACSAPSGYVANASDCDDGSATTSPGATEVCNDGVDNDCDGDSTECGLWGTIDLADADAKLTGETAGDAVGSGNGVTGCATAFAGDFNGDSVDDVVVGAPLRDDGGSNSGAAYLLLGPVTGDVGLATADAQYTGEDASDYAGACVAGVGDLDGDGYDDLAIGAYGYDDSTWDEGAVYVMLGTATPVDTDLSGPDARLVGDGLQDYAGGALAGAGDFDGDGRDDLVVGAELGNNSSGSIVGKAYLDFGPVDSAGLENADIELEGASGQSLGHSVAGGFDSDADGLDDVVIGAADDDTGSGSAHGRAWLLLGGTGYSGLYSVSSIAVGISGSTSGGSFGTAVASAGDADGDGYGDFLVGEPGAGRAYLLLGPQTADIAVSSASAAFTGSSSDSFGGTVVGGGDVNGDGNDDLLVGAYASDSGGADAGRSWLFLGGDLAGTVSSSSADAAFAGEDAGDYAGRSLALGGDVNADGLADILVGAYGDDDGGSAAGAIYLLLGGGE